MSKYILNHHLSFEARVFNLLCAVGFIALFVSTLGHVFERSNWVVMLMKAAMAFGCAGLFVFSNFSDWKNRFVFGRYCAIIGFCDVLFPVFFFVNGGRLGGMAAYFVLTVIIIVLLSRGAAMWISLAAHLIIITACYLADYYFAEQIVLPLTINQQYGDNIISVLNTALFIGLAIKGMSEMYKYEKAEADLAARVKSDFLAQMSHEMRTPMNAIVGITALLSRSDDLAGHGEELGKITNASKHLLGVINDMLDMSKIVADKLELFEEPFSFETLVRDVVGVTAHTAEAKGQTLTLELDPALPSTLIGDKQRLAQVITNLLSNAVKFTPEGGVITVKTRLAHLEAGVLRLRVAVSDTGIGISEEQAPRLFSAFEQADNSNTRRFGGTGLGLAIAKRIVEMMHGRIWVQSVFGEGSCFTFEVELGVAEGDSEADEARGGAPDFSHIRILLAEDVEINREILAALLEPTGITIDCAENGREAAEMFKTHGESYDLIFMDIQMPELDGYEATREIRALGTERAAAIPIIAMTANVLREDIERARDAGMDGHIGKPISIEAVLDVLRERCRSKLSVPI